MPGPVCCGLIPHLELARHPHLYGKPLVVGDWEGDVIACSEEAAEFGVGPAMSVRQAEHRCPQMELLAPDPEATERLRNALAAALYDLAPLVEVRREGHAWLDLEGVPRRGEAIRETRRRLRLAAGCEPRLGLASGPFSARLAAARARPGRLLEVQDARAFLAPLPVAELGHLDAEQLDRLDLLGLRSLGQVAALGPRQLESQLGGAGRQAVRLARGEEPEGLEPWQPPLFTTAHRQFEPPVEDREALLFVARAMAGDLAAELGLRGAGAKKVRLRVLTESGPEERESLVHHSLSSQAELFGLLGSWLKEWQPAAPVTELLVELPELEAAGRRQLRLWSGGDGTREEVDAAFERLQERHGDTIALSIRTALLNSGVPEQRFELKPR